MRLIFDMSSVMWKELLGGKSDEARTVTVGEKQVSINPWEHGYDKAIVSMTDIMRQFDVAPRDCLLVFEGANSKKRRQHIHEMYKANREAKAQEQGKEFNTLKDKLQSVFLRLGAICFEQDGAEGDDTIAYLSQNLEQDCMVVSYDGDMTVLQGLNPKGARVDVWINGVLNKNKYGPFDPKFVTVYKALVGDTSDGISGAPGFGQSAFNSLLEYAGDEGLAIMQRLIETQKLDELEEDVAACKKLRLVIDHKDIVYKSYELAKMHPEWVDTPKFPIRVKAGMVDSIKSSGDFLGEPCVSGWAQTGQLVGKFNYAAAVEFFKKHLKVTPYFCLDLETTVGQESRDWIEQSDRKVAVDVIASTITGCTVTFGDNGQYAFYLSVNHRDTDNISMDELRTFLELIPSKKLTVAHNAQGFELPVLFNAFGKDWKDNGWRGFFPNMVDSQIASSYYNENAESHGLKNLSKSLLGYEQVSYAEVTQGRSMDELSGVEVLSYGLDDGYTSQALWNLFVVRMELESTYQPFLSLEVKPTYLSASSFIEGTPADMGKLADLAQKADVQYAENIGVLHDFLIKKGWEGTVCPRVESLDLATFKSIYPIIAKQEVPSARRSIEKMLIEVGELGNEDGKLLVSLFESGDVAEINRLLQARFDGTPEFNVGSFKQVGKLLYEVIGLPVRLYNKPTDAARERGEKQGSARTDEDAMKMAIQMGDVVKGSQEEKALRALITLKGINTARGLYYEAYPRLIHWKTNRLHPQLRQSATNTRRFTASNPNIQQLDREYGGIRSVILPHKPSAIVASLDLAAQEVRLAAHYSRDKNLLSCYVGEKEKLRDVHSIVACRIAGCSYDAFIARRKSSDAAVAAAADKIRSIAKTVVFASFYGAAAPKIAETLGISVDEAQEYLDAISSEFSGLAAWKEKTEVEAMTKGYVRIHGGTVRHLSQALESDNSYESSKALRQASNSRIQGAGANQLKRIMCDIWDSRLLDDYDYKWMFPVHDETVHSIAKHQAVEVLGILHKIMTRDFLDGVPSGSSIGLGKNFGELIEIGEVFDPKLVEDALSQIG